MSVEYVLKYMCQKRTDEGRVFFFSGFYFMTAFFVGHNTSFPQNIVHGKAMLGRRFFCAQNEGRLNEEVQNEQRG